MDSLFGLMNHMSHIRVDELKVLTEEELVEIALKEEVTFPFLADC